MPLDEEVLRALREELGDDLPEFIGIYLGESPRLWAAALAAAEAQQFVPMRRALHTLRPSTGLVGMRDVAHELLELERLPDDAPWDAIHARLAVLDRELRAGWRLLETYRI